MCMALVWFTAGKFLSVVVLLSLAFAGSGFMLPVAWAVCLGVGRKSAGAVTGSMNMAGQFVWIPDHLVRRFRREPRAQPLRRGPGADGHNVAGKRSAVSAHRSREAACT